MTTTEVVEATLVAPTTLVDFAVIEWVPSARAVATVRVQLPLPSTVAVPRETLPSYTVIVSPGLPVPLKEAVATDVMRSPTVPESEAETRVSVGAAGVVAST